MLRVPPHRASSSEAVAWGECVCSFCGASEPTPAQPTATRRTAHPIRKVPTKAISCPWRTTTPSPSLHVSPATSTSKHDTPRTLAHLYGGLFTGVRGRGILGSSDARTYIGLHPRAARVATLTPHATSVRTTCCGGA